MQKLAAILQNASKLKPPARTASSPVSRRDWEEAVGSRIARRTQPMRMSRGLLHVRVANSAWANELSLLTDDIVRQLSARGVPVESLRFSVGSIHQQQAALQPTEIREAPPAHPPLCDAVKNKIDRMADSELKQSIAKAAAQALAMARVGR